VLPFELGNAISALMQKGLLESAEVLACWGVVQAIPVDLRLIDMRSALDQPGQECPEGHLDDLVGKEENGLQFRSQASQ